MRALSFGENSVILPEVGFSISIGSLFLLIGSLEGIVKERAATTSTIAFDAFGFVAVAPW